MGILYTAITQYLGFPKYGDEFKVMGLAPYGEPEYLDRLRKLVRVKPDGAFELDLSYFVHHSEGVNMTWDSGAPTIGDVFSPKLEREFGPAAPAGRAARGAPPQPRGIAPGAARRNRARPAANDRRQDRAQGPLPRRRRAR